jgi:hypothetical protein
MSTELTGLINLLHLVVQRVRPATEAGLMQYAEANALCMRPVPDRSRAGNESAESHRTRRRAGGNDRRQDAPGIRR